MKTTIFNRRKQNRMMELMKGERKLDIFLKKAKKYFATFSVLVGIVMISPMTAFAADNTSGGGSDIWSWLQTALTDVYNKFLSVSTIAACVAASVCLIMMNFSTDDRAVSTSRAWLKRIAISWVVLNVLGFIMTYLVNLTSGGRYIPSVT